MTQETPGKVMSLLGIAMSSMFLLFAVTFSNASFERMENPFPDPFAPAQVMATLDSVANTYSEFLAVNLMNPVKADVAYYSDTLNWVISNSDTQIVAALGLESLVDGSQPRVAGAYTEAPAQEVLTYQGGYESIGLFQLLGIK